MKKKKFNTIESIIQTAKKGGMYILVDDENRENEGDLVFCSSDVNPQKINFMAKHGRGLICLSLDSMQAKKLDLSYMTPVNQSRNQTAFTISIESHQKALEKNTKVVVKEVSKSVLKVIMMAKLEQILNLE